MNPHRSITPARVVAPAPAIKAAIERIATPNDSMIPPYDGYFIISIP